MTKSNQLISIIGPTGIGKTAVAIDVAQYFQTDIISCDSRQFYKEMRIGTASPTDKELNAATHHFIGHLSIADNYSVGDFEKDALQKCNDLFLAKKNPLVLVGGSGLYEKALTEGLDEFPTIDPKIRMELNQELNENGLEKLQQELSEVDPDYFQTMDQQNPVRVIRALEIYRGSGKTFSSFRQKKSTPRNFKIIRIGLELPREELYQRINLRVDKMIESGLIKEAESLYEFRQLNSLQTVGYRELFDHFEKKYSLDFAIEEIKKNSRRYAKRQMTWYRKDKNIQWFSPYDKDEIITYLQAILKDQQHLL